MTWGNCMQIILEQIWTVRRGDVGQTESECGVNLNMKKRMFKCAHRHIAEWESPRRCTTSLTTTNGLASPGNAWMRVNAGQAAITQPKPPVRSSPKQEVLMRYCYCEKTHTHTQQSYMMQPHIFHMPWVIFSPSSLLGEDLCAVKSDVWVTEVKVWMKSSKNCVFFISCRFQMLRSALWLITRPRENLNNSSCQPGAAGRQKQQPGPLFRHASESSGLRRGKGQNCQSRQNRRNDPSGREW